MHVVNIDKLFFKDFFNFTIKHNWHILNTIGYIINSINHITADLPPE